MGIAIFRLPIKKGKAASGEYLAPASQLHAAAKLSGLSCSPRNIATRSKGRFPSESQQIALSRFITSN